MKRKNDRLLDLASSVSDGSPVNWKQQESNARDEHHLAVIRQLRIVSDIAAVHKEPEELEQTRRRDDDDKNPKAADIVKKDECPPRWGPLDIVEVVGEGAFGKVYRAWDTRLEREVALKLLHRFSKSRIERIIEEGRLLARVRHPNVITVFGADQFDGRVGIWMEFIRGRTLNQLVREQGPLGAREATLMSMDLCRALAAIHRQGLIHRDIKCRNVMREEGGRIILMDFGAVRDVQEEGVEKIYEVSGTPLYMAPEILTGEGASFQSDIYGLGVLLHFLVTGSYPVHGSSFADLKKAHERGERELLRDVRPDLPESFVAVVEHAQDVKPENRYQTPGTLEAALASSLGLTTLSSRSIENASEEPKRRLFMDWTTRRWKWSLSVGVSVAAFLIVTLALLTDFFRPGDVAEPPPSASQKGSADPDFAVGDPASNVPAVTSPVTPVEPRGDEREPWSREQEEHVESLKNLAALHQAMGSYKEARELFERARAIQEGALGLRHQAVAETLEQLGWVVQSMGLDAEAARLYERALAIREDQLGPEHPQVAATLSSLGSLYRHTGDYEKAKPLLERALEIRERQVDHDTSDGLSKSTSLDNLSDQLGTDSPSYEVQVNLYCRRAGQDVVLQPGAHVAPGDQLFLEVTASEALHVYVVNEDEYGESYLLYPLPGYDLENPVPAGESHRLPGAQEGQEILWQVTSAGGREHFLIVTSPTRLAEFETELQELATPEADRPLIAAPISEVTKKRLRGVGRILKSTQQQKESAAPGRLFELAQQLKSDSEPTRGTWIRQITLENPRR